ncbi:tetratricopeptide repeat protein [Anditalea andensis]|uniref:Uncharacterized protein n=1 Tax=Anditalea andensis TaxID=1048983 RepID=A0A074L2B3_9BACT|nr:tetratricopeptide repeat protein [Anditalea andensis]KEO74013.1 hypothetical protein EL17_07630 [Anditalea andensis]
MNDFDKAIIYYKEGKFQEALDILNNLLANKPTETDFLLYRGRILSRLGRLEEALTDFDALINIDAQNTNFISDRAVVLHLLKKNDEALRAFDYAIELDGSNPYRYSSRAYFKDRIGDLEGAIADYERAVSIDPEDAVSYNNKGIVEEKLGYKNRAQESLRKADELAGYEPRKEKLPAIDKEPMIPQEEINDTPLTVTSYFETLKNVFTDKATRREFMDFVFKRKRH